MLKAEGLENIFKRHDKMASAVRAGVKALGFGLLADEACHSKAVTSIVPPAGIDAEALRKAAREQFGVVLAGGQEDLKGKIFPAGTPGIYRQDGHCDRFQRDRDGGIIYGS
jgi:aspartate aminotransferase-like enzyme